MTPRSSEPHPYKTDPAHREIYRKLRQHDKMLTSLRKRQIVHLTTLLSLLIGDIVTHLTGVTLK